MRNTFGTLYTLTTFGESHGEGVGGVIDGMPSGVAVDEAFIQRELDRRRPGQSPLTTGRKETDKVRLLSGIFEGKTTGTPIGFVVPNTDARPEDYATYRTLYRPSHADYTYQKKYGLRDYRGGGRSSARITLSRVVGGAFAKLALRRHGISVTAFTSQVGDVRLPLDLAHDVFDPSLMEENAVRCPSPTYAEEMAALIRRVRALGDTVGGTVTCVIKGCPAGLGEPEFSKLQACLASAMMSINAAKGFDYGSGFDALPLWEVSSTIRGPRQTTAASSRSPIIVVASREVSAMERISISALLSSLPLRSCATSRLLTSLESLSPCKEKADTTLVSCPVPSLSSRPWLPWWCSTSCLSSSRSSKKKRLRLLVV